MTNATIDRLESAALLGAIGMLARVTEIDEHEVSKSHQNVSIE